MGTLIDLRLSSDEVEIGKEKKKRSEIELIMLKSLAEIAWGKAKKIAESNELRDLYETFDNADDQNVVTISKTDLSRIVSAFESTAGERRPAGWMQYCYKILEQLEKPIDHKESGDGDAEKQS